MQLAGGQLMQSKHEVEIDFKFAHKTFKENSWNLKQQTQQYYEILSLQSLTLAFEQQKAYCKLMIYQ